MNDRWTSMKTVWTSRIKLPVYRKLMKWLVPRFLAAENTDYAVKFNRRAQEWAVQDRTDRELDDFR